jgi:hypothetical protein
MRSISVISIAMVVWRSSVIRRSWSQNSGSTLIEVLRPSRITVRVNGDCNRFIDRSILQHAPSPSITSRRGSGRKWPCGAVAAPWRVSVVRDFETGGGVNQDRVWRIMVDVTRLVCGEATDGAPKPNHDVHESAQTSRLPHNIVRTRAGFQNGANRFVGSQGSRTPRRDPSVCGRPHAAPRESLREDSEKPVDSFSTPCPGKTGIGGSPATRLFLPGVRLGRFRAPRSIG